MKREEETGREGKEGGERERGTKRIGQLLSEGDMYVGRQTQLADCQGAHGGDSWSSAFVPSLMCTDTYF